MRSVSFTGTAWNNGKHHASGAGYGIKLSASDRDQHLRREWGTVNLHLGGFDHPTRVNIDKDSLWNNTCQELINRDIGHWLIREGLAPWPSALSRSQCWV